MELARLQLLTELQAAEVTGFSRSFLARGRMEGERKNRTPTPPFIKIGRAVRYSLVDLEEWIREHRQLASGTDFTQGTESEGR